MTSMMREISSNLGVTLTDCCEPSQLSLRAEHAYQHPSPHAPPNKPPSNKPFLTSHFSLLKNRD